MHSEEQAGDEEEAGAEDEGGGETRKADNENVRGLMSGHCQQCGWAACDCPPNPKLSMNQQPDTTTLEGKIAVMQAALEGKRIQGSLRIGNEWDLADKPSWNWFGFNFRIHPDDLNPTKEPKESDVIWPDCGMVQCAQSHNSLDSVLQMLGTECPSNVYVIGKAIRITEEISRLQRNQIVVSSDQPNEPNKPREVWIAEHYGGALDDFAGLSPSDCEHECGGPTGYKKIIRFREVIEIATPVPSTKNSPSKEPKWRAWKEAEVPVGSVIRSIKEPYYQPMITARYGDGCVGIEGRSVTLSTLFESYQMLDGSPCGVKEEA